MNSYALSDLEPDSMFSADLLIDNTFMLCTPPCKISAKSIASARKWGFTHIYTVGHVVLRNGVAQPAEQSENTTTEATTEFNDAAFVNAKTESLSESEFNTLGEDSLALKNVVDYAHGLKINKSKKLNEKALVDLLESIYNDFQTFIAKTYTRYATHKKLSLDEINGTMRYLCTFIEDYRRYVLRIVPALDERNKNFLVTHSMRSTVLAVTIGLQLRMPQDKLIELGTACLLHEIGMIRIPPNLYMSDQPLSANEKARVATHPILGYNILKDANFPLSIQLGVLEHHERETGTGYPRHIRGDKISLYAKIITVACSFEAITAPRHFKEARTTYEAMIEMLKNENRQYDDIVLKALLYSLSLFPIGAYVYLSNGKIAQVMDVSPGSPKNPLVQIVGKTEDLNEDGSPKLIQTNDTDMRIVRVMNKQEAADVLKALGKVS